MTIKALSTLRSAEAIRGVKLLGQEGYLPWNLTGAGLVINLSASQPCVYAEVFQISRNLD